MSAKPVMLNVPDIRTPLPGPRGKALIDKDERFTSPSYTRVYPLAVERGYGTGQWRSSVLPKLRSILR